MLLRLNSIKLLLGTLMVLFCTTTDSLATTMEKGVNEAIIPLTEQCTLTPIFDVILKDGTSYEAEVDDLNLTLFSANSIDVIKEQECHGTLDGESLTCSPLTVNQSMVDSLITNNEISDFRIGIEAYGELVIEITNVRAGLDCPNSDYYYVFASTLDSCLVSSEFEGEREDCQDIYASAFYFSLREDEREDGTLPYAVEYNPRIEVTPIPIGEIYQQKSYKKPLPKIYPVKFFR